MKVSRRVSFCGVTCALSLLWLLMTAFPYGTVAMAALAGLMLVPASLELSTRYGWACFGVTLLLALVLVPDPSVKVLFACFLGFYPLVQLRVNLWLHPVLKWIVKFALLNTAMVLSYLAATQWLMIPLTLPSDSPLWLLLVAAPVINGVFIIYDIALCRIIGFYRVRIHPFVQHFL